MDEKQKRREELRAKLRKNIKAKKNQRSANYKKNKIAELKEQLSGDNTKGISKIIDKIAPDSKTKKKIKKVIKQ